LFLSRFASRSKGLDFFVSLRLWVQFYFALVSACFVSVSPAFQFFFPFLLLYFVVATCQIFLCARVTSVIANGPISFFFSISLLPHVSFGSYQFFFWIVRASSSALLELFVKSSRSLALCAGWVKKKTNCSAKTFAKTLGCGLEDGLGLEHLG
jgi:hypothetical protein